MNARSVEITLQIIKNVWNICKPTEIWPEQKNSHYWAFKSLKGSTFAKPDRCTTNETCTISTSALAEKKDLIIVIVPQQNNCDDIRK